MVTALDLRRVQAGFRTQREMATALGTYDAKLSHIRNGLRPTPEFAQQVCELLAERIDDKRVTVKSLMAELFPVLAGEAA